VCSRAAGGGTSRTPVVGCGSAPERGRCAGTAGDLQGPARRRVRPDARRTNPQLQTGRRPHRRRGHRRGRHPPAGAGRRADRRHRHDRDAGLRRHAPPRMDLPVAQRGRAGRARRTGRRRPERLYGRRRLRLHPDRAARRGGGRHHHRRRLVVNGTRRPRRGRAPGARGRGRSHRVRRRGADDDRAGRPPAGSGRPVHDDRVRGDRPGDRLGRSRRGVGGRPGAPCSPRRTSTRSRPRAPRSRSRR
jgi:hypothetical protein